MLNNVWNNVFNIWSLYVNLFWNWSPLILSSGLSIVSLGSTSQHLLVFCKDLGNCVMVMNHCKKCSVLLSHGRKYNAICCSCVQKFALFECRERKKKVKKGVRFPDFKLSRSDKRQISFKSLACLLRCTKRQGKCYCEFFCFALYKGLLKNS